MLETLNYLNDIRHKKLKTHQDALRHPTVRLQSLHQHYSKDYPLPVTILATRGYYWDNKKLKCFECGFEYSRLDQENLNKLSHEHYKFKKDCSHVKRTCEVPERQELVLVNANANESLATNSTRADFSTSYDSMSMMEVDVSMGESDAGKLTSPGSKRIKNQMINKDNRIKSFENVRMQLKAEDLAADGLYLASNSSDSNEMTNEITVPDASSDRSSFAVLAANVPALLHVRCAFCAYECLLFRNSLFNTNYKQPTDEHKEKFADNCQIFKDQRSESVAPTSSSASSSTQLLLSLRLVKQLDWLQLLVDTSSIDEYKPVSEVVIKILEKDDIIVKQIPKIVDSLILNELNKNNTEINDPNGANFGTMLYAPNPGNTDFIKLQDVLSTSNNVIRDKAKHPQFSIYQSRLESFRDWPATMSQQPDHLAKAGFYYYGIKDMVKCFFCNGGLKNWDHNDDPFEDHVRWFPSCQFIQQLMGRDYIEKIRVKYENADSGFDTLDMTQFNMGKNIKSPSTAATKGGVQKPKRSVSPRTLNSRLDSQIVRKIMDQKILARDSIKHAFELKLSDAPNQDQYGDDFKTPLEMARMALEFEIAKREKIEAFNKLSDIIIGQLPIPVKIANLLDLFEIRYDIRPETVRILREEGLSSKRCFALITLNEKDKENSLLLAEIIRDLNDKHYPGFTDIDPIVVIRTNWNALERQIPSLVSKPAVVSTAMVSSSSSSQLAKPAANASQPAEEPKRDVVPPPVAPPAKPAATAAGAKDEPMADLDESDLREENERLKSQRLCVVCLSKDKNVLFLPCAHLASCLDCSLALPNCPICRTKIQATVRTYT